jgi:hypothetical protein
MTIENRLRTRKMLLINAAATLGVLVFSQKGWAQG